MNLLKNLNLTYGFTPQKTIKLMHGYDDDNNNEEIDENIAYILSDKLFIDFENKRIQELDKNDQIAYATRDWQYIHNKAIFDACNEALNYERPYFFNSGIAYSWQKINQKINLLNELESILEQSQQRVLNWCCFLCGLLRLDENYQQQMEKIIQKKELQMKEQYLNLVENSSRIDNNLQLNNLSLIKDEQLYKLLIQDIKDSEYKWYLIEDDRVDILMELSDQIFEQLIKQSIKEL